MKLGIVVVYMVREENRWLWELHLAQIRRHTSSIPYTLYAGVTKLAPSLRSQLEREPRVVLVEGPPATLTQSEEHSHYLEPMIERAIADGCTHVLILHMDSFPLRDDWYPALCQRLSENSPLLVPVKGDLHIQCSSSLFFTREFYLDHRPSLLLTEAEKKSPAYRRFCRIIRHHPNDTGIGYIYRAWLENLSWIRLQSQGPNDSAASFGLLFEDFFFHLAGAVRLEGGWTANPWYRKLNGPKIAGALRILCRHLLPRRLRTKLYDRLLPLAIGPSFHDVRRLLQEDPEKFLQALRNKAQ